MSTDFRTEAAAATLNKLNSGEGRSVADLDESGCVLITRGRGLRYAVEAPSFALIIACWLLLLSAVVLAMLGVFSQREAIGVTSVALVLALIFRKIRSVVLKTILAWRRESLVRMFKKLPMRSVAIEDGNTVEKLKFVCEDEGVCLFDAGRHRVLIEGCAYRHVIYAQDVYSVEPVSGYALSGGRLVCRMGEHRIDMVIKSAGQGPLASLLQAFAPSVQATGLTSMLNRTWFGIDSPAFKQNALPPPLPSGL